QDFDGRLTHYTYEGAADIQKQHALASIEGPNGVTRHYVYDDRGRYIATFLNDGANRIDYSFAPNGEIQVTDATGGSSTLFSDRIGLIARVDDALDRSVTFGFSDTFQLDKVVDPVGQTYELGYDTRGNLTTAVDPLGHTYHFSYGALDRLQTFTDSNGNVTSY